MSLPRLVLCLTLLTSSLGFAQTPEEWNPYTPPAGETATPPPLIPADPPRAPEPSSPQGELIPREPGSERPSGGRTALRLVAAPFSGIMGAFGGSMTGAILSGIFLLPFCTETLRDLDQKPGCVVSFLAFASMGAAMGATSAVYVTGRVLGGHGEFLPSLLGAMVGATIGAISGTVSSNTLVLLLGLGTGPIIGAIAGYELSHALAGESAEPRPRKLLPFLGVAPGGGVLGGLAGRF